jgi:hypothetical protein
MASRAIVVAYLGCGCVAWYASREYLPAEPPAGDCLRCGKPSSGISATEVRVAEQGRDLMAGGWVCPRCQLVIAPHVNEHRCDPPPQVPAPVAGGGGGGSGGSYAFTVTEGTSLRVT